jgi:prepilin-type N-terminal cleavage/methylation domain-containing protein
MKSKKRGFTLPEMVVVLVIIALAFSISAALVPSMDKARDDARRLLCANNLRRVGAAMIMYVDAYDNKMPSDRALPCGATQPYTEMHPYVVYRNDWRTCDKTIDPQGKLIPLRWACLFETGFITDPNLFYCPANTSPSYKYQSYIDPPPWGTLPQVYNETISEKNQWIRIGYSYFPTDSTTKLILNMITGFKYRDPNCARFDRLDGTLPYATDVLWSRDVLSHKSGIRKAAGDKVTVLDPGLNALFKDGHIVYCTDPNVFTDNLKIPAGVVWYLKENGTFTISNGGYNVFSYTLFDMIEP